METPLERRRRRDRERYKGERAASSRRRAADYYITHRAEVSHENRRRYLAKLQFVTPEELVRCHADPRLALKIRAPNAIVCLECGQIVPGMLNNAHLGPHGLTAREYKAKWGYDVSTALVSEEMAVRLSARRRCDPEVLKEIGRAALETHRHSNRRVGGCWSLESRLNASDRKRGIARPDLSHGTSDAEIIRQWLLENRTTQDIAVETDITTQAVHERLRRIFGVHPRRSIRFAHGEPVDAIWLDKFLRNFGDLKRSQLAQFIGLPTSRLYSIDRKRKNQTLLPQAADRLIRAEREFIEILFADKGNQPSHIRSVVSDLAQKYRIASEAIGLLSAAVGHTAQENSVLEKLCAESRKEVASGREDFRARTILGWLPLMLPWLQRNQGQLQRKPSALALRFLADDHGVSTWVVQEALSQTYEGQTGKRTIRSVLIAAIAGRVRARVAGAKTGRPRDPETAQRIRQVAAFLSLGWRPKQFAAYIFPDKHAPESAFLDLRQFMHTYSVMIKAAKTRFDHASGKAQAILDSLLTNRVSEESRGFSG